MIRRLYYLSLALITNILVSKLSNASSRSAGNNRVRLEVARRTIEELEGRPQEG